MKNILLLLGMISMLFVSCGEGEKKNKDIEKKIVSSLAPWAPIKQEAQEYKELNKAEDNTLKLDPAFKPKYSTIKQQDISYSGYKRYTYRVKFPTGLSKEDIQNTFTYITKKAISQNIVDVTIFAYYLDDDENGAYTIGKYEYKDSEKKPSIIINDSYFIKESNIAKVGDIVVFDTKEEYDRALQGFRVTDRTRVSNEAKDFSDKKYMPNGTEGEVIEIDKARLINGEVLITYKVRIKKGNKIVWVSADNVIKK